MEEKKLFMSCYEGTNNITAAAPIWNSFSFAMEMQPNKLNYGSDQLPNCVFNPNWDNSLDQSNPFESTLSSIVSSPVTTTSNAFPANGSGNGDGGPVIIRELIGRLGNICNSGDVSPQSYSINNNNNSTNTSCYSTPLNSPPKIKLSSILDSQMRGNLPILGNLSSLAPFPADPGFAERAARYSCFGSSNLGGLNEQFGLIESEMFHRLMSRGGDQPSNQKTIGSQVNANVDGNSSSVNKFSRMSRSSTPEIAEFGDSREESSVSQQIPDGELSMKPQNDSNTNTRKRKANPREKAKETPSSSPSTFEAKGVAQKDDSDAKRSKGDESNGNDKAKEEKNGNQKPSEPPKDYIHVRARRGQATDSHSLAERVRREKISERMKFLQDLVPGCNKVTGKAVMLDEIINYVQSLQRQVEFLSMKLTTVNPRMDINMEALLSKDTLQPRGSTTHSLHPVDPLFPYGYQSLPNGMSSNAPETQFSINPLNAAVLLRNQSMQLPPLDGFGGAARQVSAFWEDDLQNIVQMGFGQNHGSVPGPQMKVEL